MVEADRLAFYEVLLQQLLDDGLDDAVEVIKRRIKVEPHTLIRKDHLYDIFNKCGYLSQRVVADAESPEQDDSRKIERLNELLTDCPIPAPQDEHIYKIMAFNKYAEFTNYKACRCLAQSSDHSLLAVGGVGGSLHVTPLVDSDDSSFKRKPNQLCTSQINGHQNQVDSLAFHPRRNILASGGVDANIVVHDISVANGCVNSVTELQRIKDGFGIRCLLFHPCGDFLYAGTSNSIIRIYDVATGQCYTAKETLNHHKGGGINDCSVNVSGTLLYTAGGDGSLLFWDARSMELLHAIPNVHGGAPVASVECDLYDQHLLTSSCDGQTRLIDLRMRKEMLTTCTRRKRVIRCFSRFLYNSRYYCTICVVGETKKSACEGSVYSLENGALELDFTKVLGKPAVWDAVACNDEMGLITVGEDTNCKLMYIYDPSQ